MTERVEKVGRGMTHWPDIDRCRALEAAGFPQLCLFVWKQAPGGEPFVVYPTDDYVSGLVCAAPIVTELVEEIEKFCTLENVDVPEVEMFSIWKTRKPLSPAVVWAAGSFAQWKYDENAEYSRADTLPNALADLWLWLKGRKGRP